MSAVVVATAFGGPEVLSVIDQPTPEPGPGEVRIALRSIGTNPIDWKVISGMMGADESTLPRRIGSEGAGVITAIGDGVDGLAVGDDVVAYPAPGAYAAEIVAPATSVLHKPAALGWDEPAGLMIVGVTAVHALETVHVTAGDTVLIHGAAGGVGLLAVQLATARGATVIATASASRHDTLRDLGATPVRYGDGLADRVRAVAPDGIDAALDLVGTDEAVDVSLELLEEPARLVSIAAFHRTGQGFPLIGGGPGADPGTEVRAAARRPLLTAAADGSLRVFVAARYPLGEVRAALTELKAGHATGKIVLHP